MSEGIQSLGGDELDKIPDEYPLAQLAAAKLQPIVRNSASNLTPQHLPEREVMSKDTMALVAGAVSQISAHVLELKRLKITQPGAKVEIDEQIAEATHVAGTLNNAVSVITRLAGGPPIQGGGKSAFFPGKG